MAPDHQVLATVLDVAERPPEFQREPRDAQLFGLQDDFVAEAAADVGRDDPHLTCVDAEELRQADADDVRNLGRGVARSADPLRSSQSASTALPSIGTMAWRESAISRWTTIGASLDFASKPLSIVEREKEVVGPLLVNAHVGFVARRVRIDEHRQLLEFDFDLLAEIFGLGAGRRDAHRDRLAHEAHLAVRERMPRGELVARHGGAARPSPPTSVEVVADENAGFRSRGGLTMRRMRPCATGLRRNATSLCPGSIMSDTKLPRPCRWRASSLRWTRAPMPCVTFDPGAMPLRGRRWRSRHMAPDWPSAAVRTREAVVVERVLGHPEPEIRIRQELLPRSS